MNINYEDSEYEDEIVISEEDVNKLNILTEKELSFLRIKLYKSKRSERDWSQIKELLKGKMMLTFTPMKKNTPIKNIGNMAVENGFGMFYMDRHILKKRLNLLALFGVIGDENIIRAISFETLIEKANKYGIPIMFDLIEPFPGRYYMYDPENKMISVQIITE